VKLRSDQPSGASNQKGRSESERTNRRNASPAGSWLQEYWSAKGFTDLPDGQCPHGRNWELHVRGSRRKLKAAILESPPPKARKG